MPPPRVRIADRLRLAWPWAAMLVVALYLYEAAGHFAYAPRAGELGPDFWPRAVLVLLSVVCALRLGGYLLGVGGRDSDVAPELAAVEGAGATAGKSEAEAGAADAAALEGVTGSANVAGMKASAGIEEAAPPRYPRLLLAGIALTILYVLTMGTLGFFLGTALYLALFMLVGRYRRPIVIAIVSVVGSLVFVYVFMKIVYVSLPLGIGPFQQLSLAVLAALGVH